jgi:hypothetical protein
MCHKDFPEGSLFWNDALYDLVHTYYYSQVPPLQSVQCRHLKDKVYENAPSEIILKKCLTTFVVQDYLIICVSFYNFWYTRAPDVQPITKHIKLSLVELPVLQKAGKT